AAGWNRPDTDAFWGPSIHWNTYLNSYVVLLNRSCCSPGWPQEGIYLAMNADLANPSGWSVPQKILDYGDWYPWVLGMGDHSSNATMGDRMRLFVRQDSDLELVFTLDDGLTTPPTSPPSPAGDPGIPAGPPPPEPDPGMPVGPPPPEPDPGMPVGPPPPEPDPGIPVGPPPPEPDPGILVGPPPPEPDPGIPASPPS
ncbi:MAG: hypothetical protein ABI972_22410, partial [Acidobacteriota bacterium]